MKILLKFLRENKRLFFFTLFFLLLQTICILLIPFFTEEIVDHGIAGGSIDTVLSIALKMIVSSVIGVIVSITCTYLTAKLSSKLGASIREKLYTHIQGFTLEEQKAYGPAALATRGSGDVANVQQVLVMLIQMILPGPFIGVVAVIMTWSVSRELAFIVAFTILLFFGTVIFVFWKSLDNMKAIQERIDRMVAKLREVFVGVKIIRAFDNSAYEEARTNDTFVAHAENIIAINRRFAFISPSAFLFLGFVMAAILWFGSFEVTTGAVKIGAVTAVIEYVTLALLQLLSGALVTVMIPRAVASLTRVQKVLDQQTALTDREQVKDSQYNPYMREIYPTPESQKALTVFLLYEGNGEWFDLSKKPIERFAFSFGQEEAAPERYFITEACTGCRACEAVCPQNCIDFTSIPAVIRQEHCLHCGNCMEVCPQRAVIREGAK